MSIFEDLIEELKEENLLEETVIEVQKDKDRSVSYQANTYQAEKVAPQNQPLKPTTVNTVELPSPETEVFERFSSQENPVSENTLTASEIPDPVIPPMLGDTAFAFEAEAEPEFPEAKIYPKVEKPKPYLDEKEYFRKRAMDEVTGLQMVEHVLSGIEREQLKAVPKPYDELPVKLALHDFLQDAHAANTTEHAQAEFKLMQETENWYSALSLRDKQITVAQLRRYCETSRPALSSQALIALARFYRNSPYTEQVRSKFELVMTRLFSRENEFDRRELLLTRDEIVQQVKELYADWSSIQLYSANEEDSEIVISMMKFEDFISESENTGEFDQLISTDFFNRLRMVKEDCRDNFFAPLVVVSAIEANVKIGNRYLDLLEMEKEKFNAETLEEKYGFLHDQIISDATGKTFQLVALLHEKNETGKGETAKIVEVSVKEGERTVRRVSKKPRNKLFAVNKWLAAAAFLIIGACLGLYVWAETQTQEIKPSQAGVKKVNLESSDFKDFIQTARISEDTFYGITTAAWESLNTEKKEQILKKLQSIGSDKNYKKVHLINPGGKSVGYASVEKAEVYNQ